MSGNKNPGCITSFLRLFSKNKSNNVQTSKKGYLPAKLPYLLREDFLSQAEASFFQVMKSIVGDRLLIFPKVSLADIFFVSRPDIHMPYFNKINRKHADFLLCDPKTLKPVIAVELDDSSHQRAARVERDKFIDEVYATAGLSLLHIPAQYSYNIQTLSALFKDVLQPDRPLVSETTNSTDRVWSVDQPAPHCTKCGAQMVLRTAQRGNHAGEQFYGCPNFPKCRETILIRG